VEEVKEGKEVMMKRRQVVLLGEAVASAPVVSHRYSARECHEFLPLHCLTLDPLRTQEQRRDSATSSLPWQVLRLEQYCLAPRLGRWWLDCAGVVVVVRCGGALLVQLEGQDEWFCKYVWLA